MDDQRTRKGDSRTAVIAVIMRGDRMLLGLREYKKGSAVWTAPGGRCDSDETIEETLRREVQEEVGVTDLVIGPYLGSIAGAKEGDTLHLYYCDTKQEPERMEPEKFLEWRWFFLRDIPENFISPQARRFLVEYLRKDSST